MKKSLRKEILEKRHALSAQEVAEKSQKICQTILQMPWFQKAQTVMIYMPFRNEVDTTPLFEYLWQRGRHALIPVCETETHAIIPSELKDFQEDLTCGILGIQEPKQEKMRPVAPEEIDLVIVPGVGFDPSCNRLGYGGGYYDRFLPRLKAGTPKIGVAFDLQIVPPLATDQYDMPMDMVVTEEKSYYRDQGTR